MERSSKELFKTLQRMYVPGEDEHIDSLMQLCRVGMVGTEQKSGDPIMLDLTIQNIVNIRDRKEVDQMSADLEPPERELLDLFKAMTGRSVA